MGRILIRCRVRSLKGRVVIRRCFWRIWRVICFIKRVGNYDVKDLEGLLGERRRSKGDNGLSGYLNEKHVKMMMKKKELHN